jgi:hypothetical protein
MKVFVCTFCVNSLNLCKVSVIAVVDTQLSAAEGVADRQGQIAEKALR